MSHAPQCVSPLRQLLVNADILTVCVALLLLNVAMLTLGQEACSHNPCVLETSYLLHTPDSQGPQGPLLVAWLSCPLCGVLGGWWCSMLW